MQEEVEYMGDDRDHIWQWLDEKYGNESRLIDLIMLDMNHLRVNRDDYGTDTLKLINTVERAHRDIQAIGREGKDK